MLDPDAVREFLIRSVRAASGNGRDDQYGYGHANAHTAVVVAGPPPPGMPVASGGSGVPTQ
jgi:hypothetical protein